MKSCATFLSVLALFGAALASRANAQAVEAGDLVLGLSDSDGAVAIELVRGEPVADGGMAQADSWDEPFAQSLEFDNLGGISHNPQGNLLGATFGTTAGGGTLHNLSACSTSAVDQLIGNSTGLGGDNLTLTRWGGLSVSPDNTKIALTGYDSGRVIIFDYAAGDCHGSGASLSNARESAEDTVTSAVTQGTAWLDNDTVIVLTADGDIITVDATTLDVTTELNVTVPQMGSRYTDAEFNPSINPFVYLSHSTFDGATSNQLFVFRDNFEDEATLEFGVESLETAREIALSPDGHLFVGQFGGRIDILLDAGIPEKLESDSTIDWYTPANSASFSGLDVAVGLPIVGGEVDADFNDDGNYDCGDLDQLYAAFGSSEPTLDLVGDGLITDEDIDKWLADAGAALGLRNSVLLGDTNFDGVVNALDLNVVGINWQITDATSWCQGDFNHDKEVKALDLNELAINWQFSNQAEPAQAVPEPAGLALRLFALVSLFGLRRRR